MNKIKYQHLFVTIISLFLLLRILFMFKANLLVEEAYYWNYSNHLDFGFLDHPPLVAVLIKLGTLLFAVTEWGVRFATIPCWILTCYFSFKLTALIREEARWYVILLLSILPFFFIHALIITPDIPLILSWSASLYYLYQAIVLDKSKCWYWTGLWIGIGLLSKYTIVLLGVSTIVYLICTPTARKWLTRKEPYGCVLIALAVFTPVIYWNATHGWASFLFQSARRFHDYYSFSFHELIGLILIFLTPTGILGLWTLFSKKFEDISIATKAKFFLQVYTIIPLLFFSIFSLFHAIKVNWIGPVFLAIMPWLAILIVDNKKIMGMTFRKGWIITSLVVFVVYSGIIYFILSGKLGVINHSLHEKLTPWDSFTKEIYDIAQEVEAKTHKSPVIVPLDTYNIASELSFYQQKYLNQKKITSSFKVIGSHVFGLNSLMYQYWGDIDEAKGNTVILISQNMTPFSYPQVNQHVISLSPIKSVEYQGKKDKSLLFYYKIIKLV